MKGTAKRGQDGTIQLPDGQPWGWAKAGDGVLDDLRGLRSFTITGWVKPDSLQIGSGGNRILFCLNKDRSGIDLVCHPDGRLRLAVNQWPDRIQNDSSPGKLVVGRWTRFAVTYDATKAADNVSWYFSRPQDQPGQAAVALDRKTTYNVGPVAGDIGPLAIELCSQQRNAWRWRFQVDPGECTMRTIKTSLLALATVLCALADRAAAEMPRFEAYQIGDVGHSMGQTSLVDVDRDGDLDWVVGQSGKMWWFEYVAADQWTSARHGQRCENGRRRLCLRYRRRRLGGSGFRHGLVSQHGQTADRDLRAYDNGAISCHDNVAADIDGDGRLDVVACSNAKGQVMIAWYRIPDDPKQKWTEHRIGEGIHGGVDPRGAGDLDGDGDCDVVRGDVWFENMDGKGDALAGTSSR